MSLEILSKDILLKADLEIENIEREANESLSQREEELNLEVKAFEDDFRRKFEIESKVSCEKIYGSYLSKSKRVVLEAKAQVVEEIKSRVMETIDTFDLKEKKKVFETLYGGGRKHLEVGLVICSQKDLEIVQKVVEKGVKVEFDNIINGLVLISKDGRERISFIFDQIVEDYITEMGGKIFDKWVE